MTVSCMEGVPEVGESGKSRTGDVAEWMEKETKDAHGLYEENRYKYR